VIRRSLIGVVTAALVVLLARLLAYAAVPGPSARFLARRAGGPSLPLLTLVALGLGALVAVSVCWLVSVAVRERALLERREAHGFGVARTVALAAALTLATSLAGGLLEAYLHWRAGLGWHGLHCLIGPVHRDLLPFEAGLSFVAAALVAGGRHVLAWMRRTFARLAAELPRLRVLETPLFGEATALRATARRRGVSARAPPLPG
jgi:hypothetical protein